MVQFLIRTYEESQLCGLPPNTAPEQLPVDPPGLHEVLDLIDIFQRTGEYRSQWG